jgi:hypothetical protein
MTEKHSGAAQLIEHLYELLPIIDSVDASDGMQAAAELEARLPFEGPEVSAIRALCQQGLDEGWLTPRAAGSKVRFGRLDRDLGGYAVDAVLMESAAGMGHTHTRGEINMCFPWKGEPLFDGLAPGWVVFPPGSHHVPTVTGGTMLFLYFTPGGEVVWDKA